MTESRRRLPDTEEPDSIPEWIVTYSDLVTLLLTFFILLFSMAVIDKQKFQTIASALRSNFMEKGAGELFATNKGKDLFSLIQENNSIDKPQIDQEQFNKFLSDTTKAIKEQNLDEYITVIENQNTLTLRMNSVILFDSGSAEIKESGTKPLLKLSSFLNELNREIFVQGHTDDKPINTILYPTNWELSTKRATNIVIFLITYCNMNPSKLTPTGNSEFKPIAPNDTENNRSQNRRIDIVVIK